MSKVIISFDLDGTLIRPEYNELIWFREIASLYAEKFGISFDEARQKIRKEYEKVGENDIRWYSLDYWLKYFGFKVTEKEILEKYADKVELYPEVIPALELLRKTHTLVVASAMSHSFIKVKLKKYHLSSYFKGIFSSLSDFGMIKKRKQFYQKMCQEMQISPPDLIHIGDNYEADYLAPREIGIKAFFLDRVNYRGSTDFYTVHNLEEFARKII